MSAFLNLKCAGSKGDNSFFELLQRIARKEKYEFITALTKCLSPTFIHEELFDQFANLTDGSASRGMPKLIVQRFQAVHVSKDNYIRRVTTFAN